MLFRKLTLKNTEQTLRLQSVCDGIEKTVRKVLSAQSNVNVEMSRLQEKTVDIGRELRSVQEQTASTKRELSGFYQMFGFQSSA